MNLGFHRRKIENQLHVSPDRISQFPITCSHCLPILPGPLQPNTPRMRSNHPGCAHEYRCAGSKPNQYRQENARSFACHLRCLIARIGSRHLQESIEMSPATVEIGPPAAAKVQENLKKARTSLHRVFERAGPP